MPLSGFQFGKQASPAPKPTSSPGVRLPFGAVPIPPAPRPKPGATFSPTPLPNFTPGSGMGKKQNL